MKPNKDRTYCATSSFAAVVGIIIAFGLLIALVGAIRKPQDTFNGTTIHRTVMAEPCIMDGMEHCEAVRVYEDGQLVEFYVHDKQ